MAADASIFQQYLRPVRSVAEYASDMDAREQNQIALVGARRQNELGALQLDQTRGQIADAAAKRNALQKLYSIADPMERENAMLRDPFASAEGQAARKARIESEKDAALTLRAAGKAPDQVASTDAAQYKLRIEKANTALKDIAAFQHPGEALADLQRKAQAGELPPEQAQALAQQLQGLQTPQQWAEWQRMTRYRILDAKDQLEQEWKAKDFEQKGSQFATGQETIRRGQDRQSADAAAGRGVQLQVAGLADAREGRKESAKVAAESSAKSRDASEALQLIADAEKVIDKATGSYVGAGADVLAQGVGISTGGAQASAQLKAIEGMLVSKMPKMSGPQSDKDVQLYRQMAGLIGDPTVPAKTKKAALQSIKQIQGRYAAGTAAPAAQSGAATGGWSMQRVD